MRGRRHIPLKRAAWKAHKASPLPRARQASHLRFHFQGDGVAGEQAVEKRLALFSAGIGVMACGIVESAQEAFPCVAAHTRAREFCYEHADGFVIGNREFVRVSHEV